MAARVYLSLDTIGAPTVSATSAEKRWQGGEGFLMVVFLAGDGLVTLQVQDDDTGVWVDTDVTSESANVVKIFHLPLEVNCRIRLSGSVVAAEVRATILGTPRRHLLAS